MHDITFATTIPRFNVSLDPEGSASYVPSMSHFYNNSLQTGLMRELAVDLEVLGEHVVLLGNQGVGKNKIVDRFVWAHFLLFWYTKNINKFPTP